MTGIFEGNKLLSEKDVADVLGVKPSTVSRWISKSFIPYIKFGEGRKALVRFSPKRLNLWLDELAHEPESEAENKSDAKKIKKASKRTVERFNEFASAL